MSEERPEYCEKCGAPVVWCKCEWIIDPYTGINLADSGLTTDKLNARQDVSDPLDEVARLRAALADLQHCIMSGSDGCECLNPPEDHEPPESPDDWEAHAQYCPDYLNGYITRILKGGE